MSAVILSIAALAVSAVALGVAVACLVRLADNERINSAQRRAPLDRFFSLEDHPHD